MGRNKMHASRPLCKIILLQWTLIASASFARREIESAIHFAAMKKPIGLHTPSSNNTNDGKADDHKNHFKNGACWSKAIWSLTVSTIFGVFMYVSVLLFQKYKAENTRVVCQIKPLETPFPMVTLCNMNPYKASASVRFPDLAHLIQRYDHLTAFGGRQLTKRDVPIKGFEQRRKRDSPMCKCNFDNPLTVTSKDGERTFVLYPKMVTNWSCGFACCAQSGEFGDGRLARPTKEDVSVLQAGGMLEHWILVGMYCSGAKSCKWYDGPSNPIGSIVGIESVCDNCTMVSGGPPVGAAILNYYSRGKSSFYSVTRIRDNDVKTPLCQVRVSESRASTNTSEKHATLTTAVDLLSDAISAEGNDNRAIEQNLDESKTDRLSLSADARDMVPYIMSPVELEEKLRAGYDVEDVIIRCVYNGYMCSYRNFTTIVDPNHGNCFAFNWDGQFGAARKPGTGAAGLSVAYAVGVSEYLSFIESAGIRVIISEQDKPVFPDAEGFDVMSGYRTSVSLRATALRALPTRRKPCFSKGDDLDPYYYAEKKYSTEACLRSCYQRRVIEKCQCGDPRVPIPDNVSHCPLANRHCVNEKYDVSSGQHCDCPRECSINEYEMAITKSKFSTNRFVGQPVMKPGDVLDLDVYLQSPTALECREQIDYTLDLFIWDWIDIAGTFTGVTALSVVIVMVEICCWVVAIVARKKKPADTAQEPEAGPARTVDCGDSMSVQSL